MNATHTHTHSHQTWTIIREKKYFGQCFLEQHKVVSIIIIIPILEKADHWLGDDVVEVL